MKKLILIFAVLLATSFAFAQNVSPAIFYSDLASGPNSGGQNNAGAFVTIHGKGFGASQGSSTVTIGGSAAASYQSWSDSAVTFQLGPSAKTGSIVVNVGGVSSTAVPFTVRSGGIYFVATGGSDRNPGSYALPWQTLSHAVKAMSSGSITYVENGYAQSSELALNRGGSAPSTPLAILGYPNSSVTIGSSTGITTGVSITASNWVLANLIFRGTQTAIAISNVTGIRLAGSDISCPNATASGACISTSGGSSFAFLGNSIHNSGSATSTNLASYEALDLVDTTGVEIGWNLITNTLGCNAINAQSSTGLQFSYRVHDNYIYKTPCEAIALGTVNPALGAVSIYNNIIQSSGTGPTPAGTSQGYGYAAIAIGGGSSTPAQIYNNTIYDAGAFGGASAGAVRASGAVNLTNDILDLLSGEQYVSLDTTLSSVTGSNNLFYGAGSPLGIFSNSVAGNPAFVSLTSNNFHLAAGSPAIDSGATVSLATDYDGAPRPQGTAYDIGAYESSAALQPATPAVSFSPARLTFASQTVGTTSPAQIVTVTNTGTTNLIISGVAASGNFAEANTCGAIAGLAPSTSCTISVTFTPSAAGTLTGAITVTDNAASSTQQIALSGTTTSTAQAVSFSPTSLTFANQTVATTSAAQIVTVTNTGTTNLIISGVAASGNFAETNTCGAIAGLAPSTSCTISVTFTPAAAGTLTGAITVTDNAASSTQKIALSGTTTSTAPAVSFSPASLSFASQTVGTTSAAQVVTVTNTGTTNLIISGVAASGNFAETNTCGGIAGLAPSTRCTISVTFTPAAAGTPTGTITVTDNAASSTQKIALSGTAVAGTGTGTASAALSWTENGSVSGYNVYRSTQSGTGYTKVNSSLVTGLSYANTTVTSGQTYYYVVTSVNGSGVESAYSAQVTAVVP